MSLNTKKTIKISPELFKLPNNKTKKAREKKELVVRPILHPNTIKNKLLKRIKEHQKQALQPPNHKDKESSNREEKDEFHGAMDYLSDLTRKKKLDESKQRSLNHKTLKQPIISPSPSPSLSSAQETSSYIHPTSLVPEKEQEIYTIKPCPDVPYGCLKNGNKKTFREWKREEEMMDVDTFRPPTPPKRNSDRESKLENIKDKLKKIQEEERRVKEEKGSSGETKGEGTKGGETKGGGVKEGTNEDSGEKEKPNITYIKQSIKRKFTLGKSDKLRRVSVLIKDRQTRKNVIDAQKNLKKTPMAEVRKYLRQHGMIRVGSNCPTDILRKTFEVSMMAGDVANTNPERMVDNFLHEGEKEAETLEKKMN